MDIFLTDLETGDRIRFPMLPEEIDVQTANIFQSYTIMAVGDIRLPYGEELTSFRWKGIFPGEARQYDPYIREWQSPHELIRLLETYRQREKKLRLLVTETPINRDVYIQRMTGKHIGGYGDFHYTINLIHAKELIIHESGSGGGDGDESTPPPLANTAPEGAERSEPPPAGTYTIVSGDTLWGIAQRKLGSGSRWPEIFEANRDVIGDNPDRIFPGQILTIPK